MSAISDIKELGRMHVAAVFVAFGATTGLGKLILWEFQRATFQSLGTPG